MSMLHTLLRTPKMTQPTHFRVNVGGINYIFMRANLDKFPDTLLGKLSKCALNLNHMTTKYDSYDSESDVFYFDRSALVFEAVAQFYRTGHLHRSQFCCPRTFFRELDFWEISPSMISSCCDPTAIMRAAVMDPTSNRPLSTYSVGGGDATRKSSSSTISSLGHANTTATPYRHEEQNNVAAIGSKRKLTNASSKKGMLSKTNTSTSLPGSEKPAELEPMLKWCSCCEHARRATWKFLEEPASSKRATAFAGASIFVITLSILVLSLDSLPNLKCPDLSDFNETASTESLSSIKENCKYVKTLNILDTICVAWFTMEYVVRCWASANPIRYMIRPMSVIDFFAILPFYIEAILKACGINESKLQSLRHTIVVLRIARCLRVLRVFIILKFARYSIALRIIGSTLKKSFGELTFLALYTFLLTIIFSTVMFYVEAGDPTTPFYSIPQASWWAIVTLTTLGYGDVVPVTVAGKIVASIATLSGVVLLAFPISVIVEKFTKSYIDMQAEKDGLSEAQRQDMQTMGGHLKFRFRRPPPPSRRTSALVEQRQLIDYADFCSNINMHFHNHDISTAPSVINNSNPLHQQPQQQQLENVT